MRQSRAKNRSFRSAQKIFLCDKYSSLGSHQNHFMREILPYFAPASFLFFIKQNYVPTRYFNERAAGTQQTGWSMVAQSRSFLPDALGGIIWFGADDASTTVHAPFYASIRQVPGRFLKAGDAPNLNSLSAHWAMNMVPTTIHRCKKLINLEEITGENLFDFESGYLFLIILYKGF